MKVSNGGQANKGPLKVNAEKASGRFWQWFDVQTERGRTLTSVLSMWV